MWQACGRSGMWAHVARTVSATGVGPKMRVEREADDVYLRVSLANCRWPGQSLRVARPVRECLDQLTGWTRATTGDELVSAGRWACCGLRVPVASMVCSSDMTSSIMPGPAGGVVLSMTVERVLGRRLRLPGRLGPMKVPMASSSESLRLTEAGGGGARAVRRDGGGHGIVEGRGRIKFDGCGSGLMRRGHQLRRDWRALCSGPLPRSRAACGSNEWVWDDGR